MVPEELPEGAADSAPAVEGEPEQSVPVVEQSLPGTGGSAARINWADASEEATSPDLEQSGAASPEEAAFGASHNPPEEARFSALDFLQPVKAEELEHPVTADQIFTALSEPISEAPDPPDPAASSEQVESSAIDTNPIPDNPESTLEANPDPANLEENPLVVESKEEQPDWVGDESEQVVESSEAVEVPPVSSEASVPAEPKASVGTASDSCPIYVQYLAVDPDDEPQPPPTSPNLVQEGAAASAPEGNVVRTGHSPATGSRPPRERGSRGSRGGWNRQQRAAIKNWQTDLTRAGTGCTVKLAVIRVGSG
eukprot:s1696_g1.t1